jgi:tetratricopeptide (TPR) repeat protein
MAGGVVASWELARQGLTYAGARDVAWARLVSFDHERKAAEQPDHPGIAIDSPERRESARILRDAHLDPLGPAPMEAVFDSREEALTSSNLGIIHYWAGEYAHCLPLLEAEAEEAESLGRLSRAARCRAFAAYCQTALGGLDDARRSLEQAQAFAARLGTPMFMVVYAQDALCLAVDEGWDAIAAIGGPLSASTNPALAWGLGFISAMAAQAAAFRGKEDLALGFLSRVVPWLERSPAWAVNLPVIVGHATDVLWLFERLDHVEVIEAALRQKVLAADFRSPMVDGRLALARICALSGRHEEAVSWFAAARGMLDSQGARPLRAIVDYDEALMYMRRDEPGDIELAGTLLDAARRQFEEIGMTGWIRRADELGRRLG